MQKKEILPVSQASAKIFLNQCIGSYPGHMAAIPNSPVIDAIVSAHGIMTCNWYSDEIQCQFAQFLRMVADELVAVPEGFAECPHCGRRAKKPTGEPPYRCSGCNRAFAPPINPKVDGTDILIQQIITDGGAIVSSNECSEVELADARATGRFAADDEGMGFVRRTKEWIALQDSREKTP